MKILDFKSVSPLFEMERDGDKPFEVRKIDLKDKRFRALSQWQPSYNWGIRITNPATGESFIREIIEVSFLWYYSHSDSGFKADADWKIIVMGEIVAPGVVYPPPLLLH